MPVNQNVPRASLCSFERRFLLRRLRSHASLPILAYELSARGVGTCGPALPCGGLLDACGVAALCDAVRMWRSSFRPRKAGSNMSYEILLCFMISITKIDGKLLV